jgi:hypothetical protein
MLARQVGIKQGKLDEARGTLVNYIESQNFPKPKRTYNALILTARKRLTHNFQVLASYAYSRTIGNYPGLYQDNVDQLDPNITQQYDLKDLLVNRDGPLPNDRPHNFKFLGAYFVPLGAKETDGLTVGLSFNAQSGVPIEVLGRHPIYDFDETFILPRGSGGRTPWVTSFDLRIGYAAEFAEGYKLEVLWDTYNIFNQRAVTNVSQRYTLDFVGPITNGTPEDLVNLRNTAGAPVTRDPNFGQATSYQAPIAMRLGARVSF